MLKLSAEVDEVDKRFLDKLTLQYLEGFIKANKKLHTECFNVYNENNQMLDSIVKEIKQKAIAYEKKMRTEEEQRKCEQMSRRSAVTKWSKSRKRTRSITEPTVHIGGETTQVQNTEENKKNTAEIKQKYIIPRQTQKRKIYSEAIVHIGRETTHENENTDKKNKVEVNSNASRIPKEKENTRSSEPLLHKVEVESNASRIPKEKENRRSSEPFLHKIEAESNASRIPKEKENRRSSEPLLHKVEVRSNASRIPKEKENTRSSEPLLHKVEVEVKCI